MAAGNVSDYLKQQSALTDNNDKERWDTIQNAIKEMTKTNKQIPQMQIMQDALEDERSEYTSLLHQKTIADARNDIILPKQNETTRAEYEDDTGGSSDSK